MIQPGLLHLYADVGGRTRPVGRLLSLGDRIHHLEDPHGLASLIPEGPVGPDQVAAVAAPPPGLHVVHERDLREGARPDLIPELSLPDLPVDEPAPAPARSRAWLYRRAGHDRDHLLESGPAGWSLDGQALTTDEVGAIHRALQSGAATARRPGVAQQTGVARGAQLPSEAQLRKKDGGGEDEMDPEEALQHLSALGMDERGKKALQALRQHVFTDPMTGLGNKYAFTRHRSRSVPGVVASMDLNDFKQINDTYGHDAGDDAIRAAGAAMRQAVDEAGLTEHVKLFRPGGDEFVLHAASPQHAHLALRAIHGKLDAVPPIGGTHRLSTSTGLGHSFEHADQALYRAKAQKVDPATGRRHHQPGQTPHLTHSALDEQP